MEPTENSDSDSKSQSLTLVTTGDDNVEQPLPLEICVPEEIAAGADDNKLLPRRSPSIFHLFPIRSVFSRKSDIETVLERCLRRSPRNSALVVRESANVRPKAIVSLETEGYKRKIKETTTVEGKNLRRSPRFTTISAAAENKKVLSLSAKSRSSKSQRFKLKNKGAKIMNIERTNGMGLRRSPRLTSAPPETNGRSSKTIFKSSDRGSYSETRSSGKLNGKRLCLPKTEEADKGTFPLRHNETNLRLIIERQLRRSLKFSQATKNGSSDISVRRLDMDEVVFSEEKLLGISPSPMHATENGDSNASFREHRREMSDEKQLKTPSSLSTLLAEGDSAEVNSSSNRLSNSCDEQPSKKFKISSAESDIGTSDETFSKKAKGSSLSGKKKSQSKTDVIFIGNPIPDDEAQERWRWRYEMKHYLACIKASLVFNIDSLNTKSNRKLISSDDDDDDEDKVVWNVECHYAQAEIDGCTINLGDCVYIKGEEAKHHIGKILEFFKTTDGENYFRVQWFYRAEDTVMKQEAAFHDERRLFYSTVMNDNPIDCIISKVSVTQISPKVSFL
ncbi:DNA (cytosine-5)-methyltransferase CMT2 isoform X2 [Gossypium australe]|uniref:DNA (Cytosine-5)-methyltransferase CMT2 isoform X2 n=1 Tax=Gossypium australe TaxID=47621 RepID=A0A5B6VJS6_9ROSI|nr:DNA (cytosine-5)-methyltransferase CMT2 isoform X2 [Gossypium australe]